MDTPRVVRRLAALGLALCWCCCCCRASDGAAFFGGDARPFAELLTADAPPAVRDAPVACAARRSVYIHNADCAAPCALPPRLRALASPGVWLIGVRVPKAGSSTLKAVLGDMYAVAASPVPRPQHDEHRCTSMPRGTPHWPTAEPCTDAVLLLRARRRLEAGHRAMFAHHVDVRDAMFPFPRTDATLSGASNNVALVASLREPVDRVLSEYFYLYADKRWRDGTYVERHCHELVFGRRTIERWDYACTLEHGLHSFVLDGACPNSGGVNRQTRFLAGGGGTLEAAKDNVARMAGFLLDGEQQAASVELLAYTLSVAAAVPERRRHVNRHAYDYKSAIRACLGADAYGALRDEIAAANRDDVALYRFAVELQASRYAALHGQSA
jgi:hypothetical protein